MKKKKIILTMLLILVAFGMCEIKASDITENWKPKKSMKYQTKVNPWIQKSFVDDFGDKTNKKYIMYETEGIFSNSATKNTYLFVQVIIAENQDKKTRACKRVPERCPDKVAIFLQEYNKNNPAQYFIDFENELHMKNSKNQVLEIHGLGKWNQKGGVSIRGEWNIDFINFLKDSTGIVKIAIYDGYSSSYYFEIDANGFTREYNKMLK